MLSIHEIETEQSNIIKIYYLIQTQNIIYKRYSNEISDQKFPAYDCLIQALKVPASFSAGIDQNFGHGQLSGRDENRVPAPHTNTSNSTAFNNNNNSNNNYNATNSSGDSSANDEMYIITHNILKAGIMLMYYTCSISPLNAKEFVRVHAMVKLHEILVYALSVYTSTLTDTTTSTTTTSNTTNNYNTNNTYTNTYTTNNTYSTNNNIIPAAFSAREWAGDILIYGMKTCTAIAQFDIGREYIYTSMPISFIELFTRIIDLYKTLPLATENAIETISRCCQSSTLQRLFTDSGIVWKLLPLLLTYDGTLQDDYSEESQRVVYNQYASNVLAVLAAKGLGRLGKTYIHVYIYMCIICILYLYTTVYYIQHSYSCILYYSTG